jgi:hypothetical protein
MPHLILVLVRDEIPHLEIVLAIIEEGFGVDARGNRIAQRDNGALIGGRCIELGENLDERGLAGGWMAWVGYCGEKEKNQGTSMNWWG